MSTASAIMSAKAQREAAAVEAQAMERNAQGKRLQAVEELERLEINKQLIQREAKQTQAGQAAAFIKGGVELSGSPLAVLAQTQKFAAEEIGRLDRVTRFDIAQLGRQAGSEEALARSRVRSAKLMARATILTGVMQDAQLAAKAAGGGK